jgi:hypothetical protein
LAVRFSFRLLPDFFDSWDRGDLSLISASMRRARS